jgi:Protein of unknown function (DUF4239)
MDIYWIYDIPTWQLGAGVISLYLSLSLAGLLLFRNALYRRFDVSAESNEMTNGIFSGVGVLYGLLVGLVAVAAWQNFDSVDEIVSKEAALTAALYRDVSTLKPPSKSLMQNHIRDYLEEVIHVAWPLHREGLTDLDGARILSELHAELASYKPAQGGDEDLFREALTAFNKVSEARRLRLGEVATGIPAVFWVIILTGGVLTLPLIYLFHTPHMGTHVLITTIYGLFMGSMLFLLVAVDNPLRGEISISADAYQAVLDNLNGLDPDYWKSRSSAR